MLKPRYSLRTIKTVWVALVIWSEVGVFIAASARCHWPDSPVGEVNATHILLVADPQILNERSYPERSSLLRAVSRIFVDMNLRKAWRVARSTRPHAVIFLGDMLDNGFADMPSVKYQEYAERFRSIFSSSPSLPVYYLPGNHDVGLGDGQDRSEYARSRYVATFGPLSQHIILGGHSLVMVDAPALADEDWRRESAGENRTRGLPQDLMHIQQTRAGQEFDTPLILFSHIPLYRPPDSDCGPLREKGSIPAVRGRGYQTVLSPETSHLLLTSFRPTLIFSGDDHDYCEYTHTFLEGPIPEVTVKSPSLAMGIRQPGFQLLSLFEARASAYRPCALPDQLHAYCWVYAPLVLASIVLVAVRAAATAPSRYQKHGARRSFELPAYYTPSKPPPAPSRRRSYGLRVAEDVWVIAWPPLAVYAIIAAATVFW
ncbi:Metallo-dependent phosphatase-like protein [Lactifluus subvellereus]|nr:Metallo-dependent phosphatase-like protein [Lactifluus subvellereus]